MKYILLMALACTPLFVLTTWSVVDQSRPGGETPVPPPYDVTAAEQLVDGTINRTEADSPLAERLVTASLFDAGAGELPQPEMDELRGAADAWKDSLLARDFVVEYEPIGRLRAKQPPVIEEEVRDQRETLDEFARRKRESYIGKVSGVRRVFDMIEEDVTALDQKIKWFDWNNGIAKVLTDATRLLSSGDYEGCLMTARTVDEVQPPGDPPTPKIKEEAEANLSELARIYELARYRQEYSSLKKACAEAGLALDRPVLPGKVDRNASGKIDLFFAQFSSAPSSEDEAGHDQVKQRDKEIDLAMDLETFEKDNPRNLDTSLSRGVEIVEDIEKVMEREADITQYKNKVRGLIRAQLQSAFPAMGGEDEKGRMESLADLLGMEEAVTTQGVRYIGIFYLPKGVSQWRFWYKPENRTLDNAHGDEQFAVGTLEKGPHKPMYRQWAEAYNTPRDKLVNMGGSREEWESFSRLCEKLQEELSLYQDTHGITGEYDAPRADWSFSKQAVISSYMIQDPRWNHYERILGP